MVGYDGAAGVAEDVSYEKQPHSLLGVRFILGEGFFLKR
jgi:hypothetical protein